MTKQKALVILFVFMVIWSGVASGVSLLESLLPKDLPEGWVLIEGPRLYARKTLFEHLDGQAELYFKYGYQKSVFAGYQHQERPKEQIEIDIYDMGNVLQAFGIFSRLRTMDGPGGIGLDSCADDHSLLFYKGRYFVMLYGTESNPSIMKELALSVSSGISDSSPSPKEIGYFPTQNLEARSIQYFTEGLLGHRFLKRGYQASYRQGTGEFHLILGQFKNADEARAALKTYREYLSQKGKIEPKIPAGFGPHVLRGEDSYQGKVLAVQKGVYLIGIVGFEKEKEARELLAEMIRNVK